MENHAGWQVSKPVRIKPRLTKKNCCLGRTYEIKKGKFRIVKLYMVMEEKTEFVLHEIHGIRYLSLKVLNFTTDKFDSCSI